MEKCMGATRIDFRNGAPMGVLREKVSQCCRKPLVDSSEAESPGRKKGVCGVCSVFGVAVQ